MSRDPYRLCAAVLQLCVLGNPVAAVASPAPAPEWQRETLQVRCGDNVLGMAFETERLGRATITAVTVNGSPARIEERVRIEQFLEGIGGASFQAVVCRGPLSLVIGISGSRFETPPGEEDDILELFELTFHEV